jgi:hypothetical protein
VRLLASPNAAAAATTTTTTTNNTTTNTTTTTGTVVGDVIGSLLLAGEDLHDITTQREQGLTLAMSVPSIATTLSATVLTKGGKPGSVPYQQAGMHPT